MKQKHAIFIKGRTLLIVALFATSLVGYSKDSPPLPKTAASVDLGVVEVADGTTNRVTLSDGRVFVVRSAITKNQTRLVGDKMTVLKGENISLKISEEQTDAHGVVQLSPAIATLALPGQMTAILYGDRAITSTANIKHTSRQIRWYVFAFAGLLVAGIGLTVLLSHDKRHR